MPKTPMPNQKDRPNQKIKIRLKPARLAAGLSLSQAAALTGVSKAMLGQIERGESSPTIATLWKLAKGFHLPLTAFIQEVVEPDEVNASGDAAPAPDAPNVPNAPMRTGDRITLRDSIGFQMVFAFDPQLGSESFLLTLAAGEAHTSKPHDTGVVEDILVTQGEIEVLVQGQWQHCQTGAALRFCADQPHGYRNSSPQKAQFFNTIHYPRTGLFKP